MSKRLLFYILKVLLLFSILFYTFEEPTGLVIIVYLFPQLYALLYLFLLFVISKIPKDNNGKNKNIFHQYIKQPLFLILGVATMYMSLYGLRSIRSLTEAVYINKFIESADEILYYEDGKYNLDGIKNTKFTKNVILIDYDDNKIAFLFRGDYDHFEEFKLLENNYCEKSENVQIRANLNSPGLSLTTYYPDESNDHKTSDIQINMRDEKVYSVCNIKEHDTGYYYYLGLSWSKYNAK